MGGGLRVLTSNRLEQLLAALADRLQSEPLPPMCPETIVVPGQGVARWLVLELARRHGIAAALDLPFPGAFVHALGERAAAAEQGAEQSADGAFTTPVLAMRLFRLLGEGRMQRDLGAAAAYCKDDPDQRKRLQLAVRLSACFDDYQLYRDDLLLAFERGDAGDLPHARWQMRLWQELLREVGALPADDAPAAMRGQGLLFGPPATAPRASGAHRLERVRRLLADDGKADLLPPRVAVFGVGTLPPAFLDLLQRLAQRIEVTIYAHKPSPGYFGDVARRPGAERAAGDGPPLLAAWGRQSREFFDLLLDRSPDGDEQPLEFVDPGTGSMLATLQHDLLHLHTRGPSGDAPQLPIRAGDESLSVHSAHGPLREMEIVRDQILHALTADASLTPADVMVLVPDVQLYAPYVHAVFGPVHKQLPFHVADRSPAAELPLAATFLRICGLARGRLSAPEVLLLLEESALARRFAIARPHLASLRAWVQRTRIRWGLDGAQRQSDFGLPADDGNTWRQGLDRLVLGVATGQVDGPVLGLLPDADSTASRAELLGRLCAFVDAVADACRWLSRPHTLAAWADVVERTAAELFAPAGDDERQGLLHLQAAARRLRELQQQARVLEELSPAAFVDWLEADLQRQGESRGFLRGTITVAALRPLRAVPVRVLCIAGLSDGAFPRRTVRAAFDLMAHQRRPGDRSARDDDRQLFLDALLGVRDRLVLSWIGRSQKDNSPCAPSPVLSELLEHLDAAFTAPPGARSVREHVVVEHPLQSFSPRYGGSDARLFTYATVNAPPAAAVAAAEATGPRAVARDADGREIIELDELQAFWRHPAKWYCQNVLNLRFRGDDDRDDDAEPFELNSLDHYKLQEAATRARLDGRGTLLDGDAVLQTGLLPPGPLGRVALRELARDIDEFLAVVERERGSARTPFTVVGNDYVVRGELVGLRPDALVLWRPASIKSKDLLRAALTHAAKCTAIQQGMALPPQTILLGTDGRRVAPPCWPPGHHLDAFVEHFRRGRSEPLRFFPKAAAAWCDAKARNPDTALDKARAIYLPPVWDDKAFLHDLPDPFLEFCFADDDPVAHPDFALLADEIQGRAATWFRDPEDGA